MLSASITVRTPCVRTCSRNIGAYGWTIEKILLRE